MSAQRGPAPAAPHLLAVLPDRLRLTSGSAILSAAAAAGVELTVASYLPAETFLDAPVVRGYLPLDAEHTPAASDAFVARARAYHARRPFVRAVPFAEQYVEPVAELNAALGLGGITPAGARACRDKYEMRAALRRGGVPVPSYALVRTRAEFDTAVAAIGRPCVAKPAKASASEGVVKIDVDTPLDEAFAFASSVHEVQVLGGPLLVERYVAGPELSVEAVVQDGRAHVAGCTDKTTEEEPYFAEVMHVHPAPLGGDTVRALHDLADAVVRALGIPDGGIHLEVRLTADGPVVMECAARLGGDSIPILVRLATGIDLYEHVLRQAAGAPVALTPRRARTAGIRFVQTDQEGVLAAAAFDTTRLRDVPGLLRTGTLCHPGDRVGRPPRGTTQRLAFALAVADDASVVRHALLSSEAAFAFSLADQGAS